MSFRQRIEEANRRELADLRPFRVAGTRVGWIKAPFAERISRWPEVFAVSASEVRFAAALDAPEVPATERSIAVREVLLALRDQGLFPSWREENYAVNVGWGEPVLLTIERAAVPYFGVTGYGVHLNGIVRDGGALHMWVAKRALDKPTDPGKLDQIVAGGQPADLGLRENLIKECAEEAAIPARLARRAISSGAVSYVLSVPHGIRPDVLFTFDLELPADFVPRNTDGEVDAFYLWPIERVAQTVRDGPAFKFNCSLVVIDFLVRHGMLSPEEPGYAELVAGLRCREQFLCAQPDG